MENLLIPVTAAVVFSIAAGAAILSHDGGWPLLMGLYVMAIPPIIGAAEGGVMGWVAGWIVTAGFLVGISRSGRPRLARGRGRARGSRWGRAPRPRSTRR